MNHLYYGDNLAVLRDHVGTGSVDLVHLDPPFNSNADHDTILRTASGKVVSAWDGTFRNTWRDDTASGAAVSEVERKAVRRGALSPDATAHLLARGPRLLDESDPLG